MVTRQLKGRITEDGKLEVEIPPEFRPGEITITLEQQRNDFWTEEEWAELQELLVPDPKPFGEIKFDTPTWAAMDIDDPVEFVERLRREEEERRD